MYSLSIHFGPNAMVWQFLFKEKEKADDAYAIATAETVHSFFEITDDFGQKSQVVTHDIHGVLLEDLDLIEEARIQRSLSNARGQAKYNERVKADPMLSRAMNQQRNGPAIHTPFGNN